MNYFVAVPIAVLALGLLGVLLQGMMLRLVMQQNLTSLMIVTLGFGYVFQGGAARIFGGNPERFISPLAERRDPLRRDLVHLAGRADAGLHPAAVRRRCGWC